MRLVVLGGGFAGLSALNFYKDAIVIDSKEYFLLTHRLTDVIETGNPSLASIPYPKGVIKARVLGVDFKSKVVRTTQGHIGYDKLIISLGYEQDTTRVKGNIQKLENLEDALTIRAKLSQVRSVAVLGGGTLGVELAGSLREMGKNVYLIEFQDRLLSFMSKEASQFAEKKLRDMGVNVMLKTKVEEVKGEILKTDKDEIKVDMSIAAAGFRGPRLVEDLGLTNKNGRMLVDDYLRSVDFEDVYGSGDCMTTKTFVPMSAQVAVQSGKTAAENALGGDTRFSYKQVAVVLRIGPEYFGDMMGKFVKGSMAELAKRVGIYRAIRMVESL
ncbi:NAD(P)/FAD-dependent oxidoreductase [Metallosphaera hakonensis]|uniref:NADH:ubiquinone reductase (non-electrogenic) n=1 Tax=Metallosphaera hakonensis JCM 8857 = DSM 7519 TaxID=1293036 RepID=A0A2U9IW10_9CREN|nr:FAD-dependent oxidoreductase [Metallosphaera hakonensis]AWS00153.1 pyridine nucleotide-disulfide oxidoreductase [Metallosphaera hakonensis JCM 8857 = DSM 7519]